MRYGVGGDGRGQSQGVVRGVRSYAGWVWSKGVVYPGKYAQESGCSEVVIRSVLVLWVWWLFLVWY